MSPSFKRVLSLISVLGLACLVLLLRPPPRQPQPPAAVLTTDAALSALAEMPDWNQLDTFQHTITMADFEHLLTTVFTTGDGWKNFLEIDDSEVRIRTGNAATPAMFHLRFALPGRTQATPRKWHRSADLPPAPPGQPLAGLRIAIDPGHLGGQWAQLEERWFAVGGDTPVCEGDLTLLVARLLKPRLAALGATVLLVRTNDQPVTPLRPDSLRPLAARSSDPNASPATVHKLAERLFYRTAEIHARAHLVNHSLHPDLVLCLHFNAASWGDPHHPTLVTRSHFHLLLNGAYTDEEIALADQRFSLLEKLLRRTHEEESLVGTTIAETFAASTKLPPFAYPAGSLTALPVDGQPYLWARNLLANRLYDCPVIFLEPYVMNSTSDYPRLQAGDYDGLRKVNGKSQPSIFREYADALAQGLARHYAQHRPTTR